MVRSAIVKSTRPVLVAGLTVTAFVSLPVWADEDEHGPKVEVKDNGKDYKYEYQDRHCKYEYQYNSRTGEEKTERKGDCRSVSPHRAVYYSEDPVDCDRGYEGDYDREVPSASAHRLSCDRELAGRVLGGIAGAAAGAQVGDGSGRYAATAAGAVIGAVIGGTIGRRMDRKDHACAHQALEFASAGETAFWRNPDSQLEFGITPQGQVRRVNGRECRRFTASVGGSHREVKANSGLACRRADGSWAIEYPTLTGLGVRCDRVD